MTTLAAVAERTSELEKAMYELTTTMHGLVQHTVTIAQTVDSLRQEMERFVREMHSSYERLQTQQSELSAAIATLHGQYVREMAALRREAEERDRAYREEMAALRHEAEERDRTYRQEMAALRREAEERDRTYREEMTALRREAEERDRAYRQEMAALRREAEEWDRQLGARLAEIAAQYLQIEANAAASRERYDQEMAALRREAEEHERAYREEMAALRREAEADYKKMRITLAEQSLKMGTLAEDLVAPSVPRILAEVVKCSSPPQMLGVRIRKRLPDGRSQEYDVMAVCDDVVLINETKTRLQTKDVNDFIDKLRKARDFLPEYADKKIIGALASFFIDPSLVRFGERRGLIMLGVVDGLMEILNRQGFVPATY